MKATSTAPTLFQYPGNVVILDDDVRFTDALSFRLLSNFTTTVFNSPNDATAFFAKQELSIFDRVSLVTQLKETELDIDGFAYTLNYTTMVSLLGNIERYQEPTVLLVDYQMPQMTGLEFLSQICNKKIKKILLTAHDEKSLAVSAFNSGLIDKFIVKDPLTLDSLLLNEITQLNYAYFQDISFHKLGKDLLAYLYDPNYEQLFTQWLGDFDISEYYRMDDYGTVLGVNSQGKPVWLILQTMERQEAYVDIFNAAHDKPLSADKMIYLFSEQEKNADPSTWDKFICDIKDIVTIQDISMVYSIVENSVFSLPQLHLKTFA
ncbi:MAG: response regulator [Gammaproteobacteria bacterium]|nr:response regulator [Gammaproteobacteria bacterium]